MSKNTKNQAVAAATMDKEELKARLAAGREAKAKLTAEYGATLRTFLNESADLPENVVAAISFFVAEKAKKSGNGVGNGQVSLWKRVSDKFTIIGDKLNLMELFKEFRTGEKEMRWVAKEMAKKDQKWLQYNSETMDFELIHVGEWTAKAPYVFHV